jgi:hypothetical protein
MDHYAATCNMRLLMEIAWNHNCSNLHCRSTTFWWVVQSKVICEISRKSTFDYNKFPKPSNLLWMDPCNGIWISGKEDKALLTTQQFIQMTYAIQGQSVANDHV